MSTFFPNSVHFYDNFIYLATEWRVFWLILDLLAFFAITVNTV